MLLSTLGLIFVLSALTTPVAAFMSILQRSPAILRWREHQDFEDHVRANSPEAKTSTLPLPRPKSKAMSRSSQKEVTSSSKSSGSTSGAAKKTEGKAKPKIARSAESMAREKERLALRHAKEREETAGKKKQRDALLTPGQIFRMTQDKNRKRASRKSKAEAFEAEKTELDAKVTLGGLIIE